MRVHAQNRALTLRRRPSRLRAGVEPAGSPAEEGRKILSDLPDLVAGGKLEARRVELIYVPQVPRRPAVGGAPNRPLRDRSKVG